MADPVFDTKQFFAQLGASSDRQAAFKSSMTPEEWKAYLALPQEQQLEQQKTFGMFSPVDTTTPTYLDRTNNPLAGISQDPATGEWVQKPVDQFGAFQDWSNNVSFEDVFNAGNMQDARTWVAAQYGAGSIDAQQAQDLYNKAYVEEFGSLSPIYTEEQRPGGSSINGYDFITKVQTPYDFSSIDPSQASLLRGGGADVQYDNRTEAGLLSTARDIAIATAVGAATGGAGLGLGSISSAGLGSAASQLATTGSIDPAAVLKSAAMAGVGGYFKDLVSGATSTVGSALDNAIWDISGATGLDYDTVSGVLSGAATGALGGRDVESILKGAAGGIASNYAQGALIDRLGSSFDVANVFDSGNTNVDTAALFPVVDTAINAAISGDLSAGDVLGAGRDYLSEGGSLGFLDPGLDNPLTGSNFGFNLPDLGYIDDTYLQPIKDAAVAAGDVVNDTVIQPAGDALASFDDAVLQPIKDALPQGTTPNIDLPDADLPSVDLPSIDLASSGSGQSTGSVSDKEWSNLFAYTTITPYQKKQLAPYVDYIKQARGMLS